MAVTLSAILQLMDLATGDSAYGAYANWGEVTDANLAILEKTVGEVTSKSVTSADVTLSATEELSLVISLTGTLTGNRSVNTSGRKGFWIVANDTSASFSITFKPTAGNGVVVPQGSKMVLFCDGTNILEVVSNRVPSNYIYGLTLSNNVSDATNDIDIAAGEAASNVSVVMRLTSGLTKRLDASWAVGTNQGGLDTGAIANTTYHVWLIQRSDTGVVDVLFSTSATAPTMPSNYDRKRRIGSFIRSAGAILAFKQDGDRFLYATSRAVTYSSATANLTMNVPSGINCRPLFGFTVLSGAGASGLYSTGGWGNLSESSSELKNVVKTTYAASEADYALVDGTFTTNTSGQLRQDHSDASGSTTKTVTTYGWYDSRL